ncbi:hypothetical protein PV620_30070 [Streptomyces sp. ME02-6978a]|uniref:hypothetical protein n=1 Tax=unclassified Streptomyces TaxID=2593676 RepID=UPI0029AD9AE2|nr:MULTISPECIES: hypothetical protein [unclassified Streptomyces]MDX3087151.1 hypothetical protein [Streptomyces sp. ME12-02E]MDX3335794.1 hypothetical protein [Streptomyces sp. ME02-6978a]
MESPRCWFFFSDDVPEGEVIVPIRTQHGLAFACRPGEMTEKMLAGLNEATKHVLGVGLAVITDNGGKPPKRRE